MEETTAQVYDDPTMGPYAEIHYEGKAYRFRRQEDGTIWCFWWSEGRLDVSIARHLNPFATKALSDHSPAPKPQKKDPDLSPIKHRPHRHWMDDWDD